MLHCFECGKDLPDNVLYCLYCGAELNSDFETARRPKPFDGPVPEPAIVEPIPTVVEPIPTVVKQKSGIGKFILGGVVGAGLVIVALFIGAVALFYNRTSQSGRNVAAQTNRNIIVSTPTALQPSPTVRKATATPTSTPVENDVHFITKLRGCEIINPEGGSVNLRRYCDSRDCSTDPDTLYIQVDPGTYVEATDHDPVVAGHYTWLQIRYDDETLWVSAARVDCEDL